MQAWLQREVLAGRLSPKLGTGKLAEIASLLANGYGASYLSKRQREQLLRTGRAP